MVMDPISIAVGAAVLATGWVTGRLGRRRPEMAEIRPVGECGCGHSLALHDTETTRCTAEIRRVRQDAHGNRNGHEWVPCSCQRYVGEYPVDITTLGLPGMPVRSEQKERR